MSSSFSVRSSEAIRIYFEDASSGPQKAIAELNELIGYPYPLKINWSSIREDIPVSVLDDKTLIPRVSDAITIFIRKLVTLLEADVNNFADGFIDKTQLRGRQIVVKVHPLETGALPFTRFTDKATVEFYLPRVSAGFVPNSTFGDDLEEALGGYSPYDPRAPQNASSSLSATETQTAHPSVVSAPSKPAARTILPSVNELARPELLLKKVPLYLRLTENRENTKEWFELEGYQPCVDLVRQYLEKHANRSESFEMWQRQLRWGEELTVLVVSSNVARMASSPLVVVALLEGELGFERVGDAIAVGNRIVWQFKRDEPMTVL